MSASGGVEIAWLVVRVLVEDSLPDLDASRVFLLISPLYLVVIATVTQQVYGHY